MNVQHENEYEYIDLRVLIVDFWKGIKKFWYLLILLALIGMIGMVCYRKNSYVPLYATEATVTVRTNGNGIKNELNTTYGFYYDKETAMHIGATFPYIINSEVFQSQLKEVLDTEYIHGNISVSVIENSNMVTLKAVSEDCEESWKILNGVMQVYPKIAQYVIGDSEFEIINEPEKKNTPINKPDYKREGVQGIIFGLCAGLAIAMVYALTRKTIRTEEDIKQIINRPCLAVLPEIKYDTIITKLAEHESKFSENMYSLQNRVHYLMEKNEQKVLLVTSTVPAEGKTTLTLNLAIAMAQCGLKVLLMDGDLRKPELNKRLEIEQKGYSLRDVLAGKVELKQAVQYLEKTGIYYLGAAEKMRNSVSIVQSKRMENLFLQAREFAEIVIVDTPPCGMLADAAGYYEYADSVMMVIKQDWINKSKVLDAIIDLPEHGNKLIGCVLNMAEIGFGSYGYSSYSYGKYKHYQGHYYGERYGRGYEDKSL